MEIKVNSIKELDNAAKIFLDNIKDNKIFAFYGKMGAGKTTFIKAVCLQLGVDDDSINSPTFAIVNEYLGKNESNIYHFDFYRIEDIEEAYDFGYEDYFYTNSFCFIEWPERIEELLPPETISVNIDEIDGERIISFKN
ncbi:MAG: tRNA (adenosine(37)-N6)-threonylcarbamoyltransferase complex ATPase subunit type 1 TsaE [Marinifilaceae bacterium]|jgi:tRNA threonylcarbamoyladenosine biosynthesis protein TsaE|nr:tRNA (adenosine(37)-N6)-threonylcarbamoyltransferase complex ATPase subunit type 1 TsaE [Marinifilaceae bacterium]